MRSTDKETRTRELMSTTLPTQRWPSLGDVEYALELLSNPARVDSCGAMAVYSLEAGGADRPPRCHLHQIYINSLVDDKRECLQQVVLTFAALLAEEDITLPQNGKGKKEEVANVQSFTVPASLSPEVSTLLKTKCGFREVTLTTQEMAVKGNKTVQGKGPKATLQVLQARLYDLVLMANKLEKRRR